MAERLGGLAQGGRTVDSKNNILVVGGYGQVGRVVSLWLGQHYPGRVIAAGRSFEKAQSLAAETSGRVRPLQLDLDNPSDDKALLDGVRVAVASLERPGDDPFVRACLAHGVHYVEVGASFEALQRVLLLDSVAQGSGAAAVASTGLIPGLSNLLAAHLAGKLDHTHSLDIYVMLGLGDTHGVDAIRWMLANADRRFTVQTPDGPQTVESLTDPKQVTFPGEHQPRTAYRFDIADQHVLPATTGAAGASTRLCFDVRSVTWLLAGLKRVGLVKAFQRLDPAMVAGMLGRVKFGSDRFALQVEATGMAEGQALVLAAGATGRGEAHATGIITALTAEALYQGHIPLGVHHVEQVIRVARWRERLENEGIRLWLP